MKTAEGNVDLNATGDPSAVPSSESDLVSLRSRGLEHNRVALMFERDVAAPAL